MLGQGQARGQQPQLQAALAQPLGDFRPFRVEQRLPARYQNHPGAQLLQARQQPRNRFEIHVGAAVAPVVAGDAA